MPSTNKTQYLQLNQFIGTDKNKRVDYNADMLNIENTVKTTFKNLSFNNGTLTATKIDNSQLTLNVYQPISNENRGITSFNEIKQKALEKIQEFGIGGKSKKNIDITSYLATGIYSTTHSTKIDNKTTTVINSQYDTNHGVQLLITEETHPKAYLRARVGGSFGAVDRVVTESRFNELINAKRARLDDIWAGV